MRFRLQVSPSPHPALVALHVSVQAACLGDPAWQCWAEPRPHVCVLAPDLPPACAGALPWPCLLTLRVRVE